MSNRVRPDIFIYTFEKATRFRSMITNAAVGGINRNLPVLSGCLRERETPVEWFSAVEIRDLRNHLRRSFALTADKRTRFTLLQTTRIP